jgi:hypothetical protein
LEKRAGGRKQKQEEKKKGDKNKTKTCLASACCLALNKEYTSVKKHLSSDT